MEEDKKIPKTENVSFDQNDNFIDMCEKDNNSRLLSRTYKAFSVTEILVEFYAVSAIFQPYNGDDY